MVTPRRGELEVLVPLGDEDRPGANPAASEARPRWPRLREHRRAVAIASGAALVLVVAAVAVAVPGRHWLLRRQLTELDRQWQAANEDDLGRFDAEGQLEAYVPVGGGTEVAAALAGVYREERADLLARRRQLQGAILVDRGLSRLRGQMVRAVGDEAALLAKWAGSYQAETGTFSLLDTSTQFEGVGVEYQQANTDLLAQLQHWGVPGPKSPAPPTYPAARDALAKLSRWSDQSTGTVLLAASAVDGTLSRLDVDASRASPTSVPTDNQQLVSRTGYLASAAPNGVVAYRGDGMGPPRLLAAGDSVMAAANPADVWVVDSSALRTSEVDGSGRVVAGPYHPPGFAVAATTGGLVLVEQLGLAVWDAATGRVDCRVTTQADAAVEAAAGHFIVWQGADGVLHVTNVSACRDVLTQPVGDPTVPPAVAFSPDGKTLALSEQVPSQTVVRFRVELVDMASGRVSDVPDVAAGTGPDGDTVVAIVWSADGQRLWWLCASQGNVESYLLTWRVGDSSVQILRAVNLHLQPPLLLATS